MAQKTQSPDIMAQVESMTPEEVAALAKRLEKLGASKQAQRKADYEAKRETLVRETADAWMEMFAELRQFKQDLFKRARAFIEEMKQYGEVNEDQKNVTIYSKDKEYKLTIEQHTIFGFDERGELAASKVKEFLRNRTYKRDRVMYDLVMDLLEKRNSSFDPRKIMKLYEYENKFNDPLFSEAIKLFKEGYIAIDAAPYIRLYKRDLESGKYEHFTLNFASI